MIPAADYAHSDDDLDLDNVEQERREHHIPRARTRSFATLPEFMDCLIERRPLSVWHGWKDLPQ